uniref:Uncharacterized protein n=1 Tax=Arundo donax TaxID=35708 RepID=A0A0A8ZBF5_ARUDO
MLFPISSASDNWKWHLKKHPCLIEESSGRLWMGESNCGHDITLVSW